jgi:hypothetical protein
MPHQGPVAFPIRVDKAWEVWISRAPTIFLDVRRHPPPRTAWSRVHPLHRDFRASRMHQTCGRPGAPRRSVARSKIWSGYRCKPIVDKKSQKCGPCEKSAPRTPWPLAAKALTQEKPSSPRPRRQQLSVNKSPLSDCRRRIVDMGSPKPLLGSPVGPASPRSIFFVKAVPILRP